MAQPDPDPRADADLAAFVASGAAFAVATSDEDLRPSLARGFGPELAGDGCSLRLCVTATPGSDVLANLERRCRIAIGFSPPSIARAVQLKGAVESVGELEPADRERMARHLEAFVAQAELVGMPESLIRRFAAAVDCVAVTCAIHEVYDQTPGPNAGRRL